MPWAYISKHVGMVWPLEWNIFGLNHICIHSVFSALCYIRKYINEKTYKIIGLYVNSLKYLCVGFSIHRTQIPGFLCMIESELIFNFHKSL